MFWVFLTFVNRLPAETFMMHVSMSSFQTQEQVFFPLLSFLALSGAAVGKWPQRDRLRAGQQ